MEVKYLVIENQLEIPCIIIFSESLLHSDFKHMIGKIISAGFVNLKTKCCYEESISLKLKSNPERDNILLKVLIGY